MKILEERILKDGLLIEDRILKVDSFLNFQIDVELTDQMGREFARIFRESGATKVLTVETSGLPVAYATAKYLGDLPLLFAKKNKPNTNIDDDLAAEVKSFTKEVVNLIRVPKKYLNPGERVLIIDDFLASGAASLGLLDLIEQAGATCVGVGIAVEKEFQGGRALLEAKGLRVVSLAHITKMKDGQIEFHYTE
ncbi:MAG: xanthine phosphoribosyltransferase [Clostridia bacterium]|nr:xanthine phosphoribosyltransferase [Clostridia bacterium]